MTKLDRLAGHLFANRMTGVAQGRTFAQSCARLKSLAGYESEPADSVRNGIDSELGTLSALLIRAGSGSSLRP